MFAGSTHTSAQTRDLDDPLGYFPFFLLPPFRAFGFPAGERERVTLRRSYRLDCSTLLEKQLKTFKLGTTTVLFLSSYLV